MTVVVPLRLVSIANARMHWAAKAKLVKAQRQAVAASLLGETPPALPVVVTICRVAPRLLDMDNAVASMKATIDQTASFLGVDDRDPRVTWRWAQRRGEPKQYRVEITIEPRAAVEAAA